MKIVWDDKKEDEITFNDLRNGDIFSSESHTPYMVIYGSVSLSNANAVSLVTGKVVCFDLDTKVKKLNATLHVSEYKECDK